MQQLKQLISDHINQNLSEKRFQHVLSVAEIARELAIIHNLNPDDAEIAALLHDVAREWDLDKLTEFANQNLITITNDEEKIPILLHGKVGAEFAKQNFNINDENILNAIRNHTNGAANMSPLEMIIFLSDSLSWQKVKNPEMYQNIFSQASNSLTTAVSSVYKLTYEHFIQANTPIADNFIKNRQFYRS